MIDYPELVQKVVNLVGGRGLLGKLLKKAARTVGNWISGTNQPCEMAPVKMLILLIDSENKEDRAYAVNIWHKLLNTDFRPIKELQEKVRLVESESSFQETLGSQKIDLKSPRSDFLYGQKKVEVIKKRAEGMLLLEAYDAVWKEFGLQKRRQGQRSDLKKAHQPAQVLGCKEKEEEDKNFSSLRPNQDEVMFFSGRSDVFIANILNLPSKNDVHSLRKVRKDGNPILIGVMNRRELTPCRTADFIGLPADVQDRLLKKSKEEQVAGIKAWKAHPKQGGETEKK